MSKIKYRVKKGDLVKVLAGKDKGRTGKVLRIVAGEDRVFVEGANLVKRHQKASGEQPGQILEKEAALHISNVAFWNADESRTVKIGYTMNDDGKKVRIDRKSGNQLDA
jgi:large subunit ribosomal protein L24